MTIGKGVILTTIITITLIAAASVTGQDFGEISEAELTITAPEAYPEANALILLDRGTYTITRSQLAIDRHRRIKILTEAGKRSVDDISISYNDEWDEIRELKAHTITPDGVRHKVKPDEMHIKEYGDYREQTITFPSVEPGCIIEYSYRHLSERLTYLKPWFFQNNLYTISSSFTVNVAPGFVYNVSFQGMSAEDGQAEESSYHSDDGYSGGLVEFKTSSWNMTDLLPIKREPYMAALNDYRSSLRFQLHSFNSGRGTITYIKGWDERGADFKKWTLDAYLDSGRKIKKLAKEITKGATTDVEKAKAVYAFVVSEYKSSYDYTSRYFVHERQSSLLEQKSGSPEEKNLLFATMLQAVGIDVWPVLISQRDHGKFLLNNPDLQQVNYLLAVIQFGESYFYVDCSSDLIPYGMIPSDCCNEYGLLLDGKKSKVIRLPSIVNPSYRIDLTRMYVESGGAASCSTLSVYTGYYATDQAERYERKGASDYMESQFTSRLGYDSDLGEYECERDSLDRFNVTLDFSSDDLTRRVENRLLVLPVCFDFRWNPFRSEKRFFPVDFNYPFVYQNITHMFFADSVASYTLPEDISLEIDGVSFVRQSFVNDTLVQVLTQLSVTNPVYQPFQYYQLREFFKMVAEGSNDEVIAVLARGKD